MSSRRYLCMLAVLGGCFHSQSHVCADGTICPVDTVCAPAGGSCVTMDQLVACDGKPDGSPCTLTNMGTGTCLGGICTLTCGDGVVAANEQCDDANVNPADGCDMCVATAWTAKAVVGGGALPTDVGIFTPQGLAIDEAGNTYLADTGNNRIRRIDASGVITTVAGNGVAGSVGDHGPATSASLSGPTGLAIDGLGNLFIADTNNHCVRRVDGDTGVITTVAGLCHSGIGSFGGDGGPATLASLNTPSGVAVDGLGRLYVADTLNNRIRSIDLFGTITTVAGSASTVFADNVSATAPGSGLNTPSSVVAGPVDEIFIADTVHARIRHVTIGGNITTVAGTLALTTPQGLAIDTPRQHLAVGDIGSQYVIEIDVGTHASKYVAGTGVAGFSGDSGDATSAAIHSPFGVAYDPTGAISFTDTLNQRIRRVDATNKIDTIAGTGLTRSFGDGGAATSAFVLHPYHAAIDAMGNLFVADQFSHRIRRIDATTGVISVIAGTGTAGFSGDNGPATKAQLDFPYGVAVDAAGNVFIADTSNHRIRRVDANTQTITTVAGTGVGGFNSDGVATSSELFLPNSVVVDAAGNLFVADTQNSRIRVITGTTISTVAGSATAGNLGDNGPATSAQLSTPNDVAVDAQGNLYIADTGNNRIRKVTGGTITAFAGTGGSLGDGGPATSAQLSVPTGVAVAPSGDVLIADSAHHRIRRVSANVITTLAGTGTGGFLLDGDVATNAQINNANGVVTDTTGNVYIVDSANSMIRRVDGSTQRIRAVVGTIDPDGMGPVASGRLADPRAFTIAAPFTLFAGGASGTIQALRDDQLIGVVAGRYPQVSSTGMLARFRDSGFGTVTGLAFDPVAHVIYASVASSNQLYAIAVTDPADATTWTITTLASGSAGYTDDSTPIAAARFREPGGLYLDTGTLYVADTGNHVVRAINLAAGAVQTIAGRPQTLGFGGDGASAATALLYRPSAIVRCGGDLFVADTGNNRVRRVSGTTISTVLGDGTNASSGDGKPATAFPVNAPLGLACDGFGNVFVSSTNSVRMLAADDSGAIDGRGLVTTIYGQVPRDQFPASVTRCLTGLAVVDPTTVRVADACTGILVELARRTK